MSRPNYRVLLSYDGERKVFIARVPEIAHCTGEGATRAEALLSMETELDALLQNLNERNVRPPTAIDDQNFSGEVSAKVSRGLHRELSFQAQSEGVELGQLVGELLAAGLEHRQRARMQRRGPDVEANGNQSRDGNHGDRQPRRDNFEGNRFREGGRGDRNTAARFHGLLEDRASFMEYVRGIESESNRNYGSQGRGGPGTGGGPGGGGFGGGRRGPDRRDNRGPGGPGGDRGGPGGDRGRPRGGGGPNTRGPSGGGGGGGGGEGGGGSSEGGGSGT